MSRLVATCKAKYPDAADRTSNLRYFSLSTLPWWTRTRGLTPSLCAIRFPCAYCKWERLKMDRQMPQKLVGYGCLRKPLPFVSKREIL